MSGLGPATRTSLLLLASSLHRSGAVGDHERDLLKDAALRLPGEAAARQQGKNETASSAMLAKLQIGREEEAVRRRDDATVAHAVEVAELRQQLAVSRAGGEELQGKLSRRVQECAAAG